MPKATLRGQRRWILLLKRLSINEPSESVALVAPRSQKVGLLRVGGADPGVVGQLVLHSKRPDRCHAGASRVEQGRRAGQRAGLQELGAIKRGIRQTNAQRKPQRQAVGGAIRDRRQQLDQGCLSNVRQAGPEGRIVERAIARPEAGRSKQAHAERPLFVGRFFRDAQHRPRQGTHLAVDVVAILIGEIAGGDSPWRRRFRSSRRRPR